MNNINLVKMKKHELFTAWHFQKKGFMETLKKYKDYKTSPATESLSHFSRHFFNNSIDTYWVILNNKRVGAIELQIKNDCIKIARFYILKNYRNKGIGQQALLIAEALYPNAKRWRLDTIFEEKNNIHLYEKLGYIPCGVKHKINERMTIIDYEKRITK